MSKENWLRCGLDLLYFTGLARAFSPIFRGMGAIIMLHHVRHAGGLRRGFAPNSELEVTPGVLHATIEHVKTQGYDLISLEEAVSRLKSGASSRRPFIVFTIDDAYRDILIHALPIFRRHNCPFTIFAAPAITDGSCELWWIGLEAIIAGSSRLSLTLEDQQIDLATITDAQKRAAWEVLYRPFRRLDEYSQRNLIRSLCAERGISLNAICRAEAMDWNELRTIAKDPLCTIGAHTVHHYALAKLPPSEAIEEVVASASRIEQEVGRRPRYFAYPYGDSLSAAQRDFEIVERAGMEAAVTTRKGLIFPAHKDHLCALPRVSLNGHYQQLRYLDVFLSGTAFAVWNGFRRFKTA
jgi:peptidoglycan/xylan/chitin deacetylase (PgdA/CDA1 family)